jgi:hypothetical protein
MRWTVVLVSETEQGLRIERPLLSFVRDQQVVLEQLGLTLAEGKPKEAGLVQSAVEDFDFVDLAGEETIVRITASADS